MTGRVGLLEGQDTMNGAASVYTSFSDKGTSNGDGNGLSPSEARIYDEWRDSTVKIEPAAVK